MTSPDIGFYGGGRAGSTYQDPGGNTVQVSEDHPLPVTIAGGVTVELPDDVALSIDGSVISLTPGTEVALIDGTVVGLAAGSTVRIDESQLPLDVTLGDDPIEVTGEVTLPTSTSVHLAAGTAVSLANGSTVALASNTTVGLAAGSTVALASNTTVKVTADSPLPVLLSGTSTVALASGSTVKVTADSPLDVTLVGSTDPIEVVLPDGETMPVSGSITVSGPVTINDTVPLDVNVVSGAGGGGTISGSVEVTNPDGEALEVTGIVDLLGGAEVTIANNPTVHLAADASVKVDDTTPVRVNIVSGGGGGAVSGTVDLAAGAEVAIAPGSEVALAAGTTVGVTGTVGITGTVDVDDATPLRVNVVTGGITEPVEVTNTTGETLDVTLDGPVSLASGTTVKIDDATPVDVNIVSGGGGGGGSITGPIEVETATGTHLSVTVDNDDPLPVDIGAAGPLDVNIVSGGGGVASAVGITIDGQPVSTADESYLPVSIKEFPATSALPVALETGAQVELSQDGAALGVLNRLPVELAEPLDVNIVSDPLVVTLAAATEISLADGSTVALDAGTEVALADGSTVAVTNAVGETLDVTVDGAVTLDPASTVHLATGTQVTLASGATVGITGTVPVSGSVAITGTPTVSVTGTTTVSVSGTPAVTISGTPTVNVAEGGTAVSAGNPLHITGTVTATPSGTQNVSVTNTPAVTVSGTPAVTVSGIPNVNIIDGSNWLDTPDGPAARVVVQNYASFPTGSGGGGSGDTELPAAAALTDTIANPTTPQIGADGMSYNGTTWERNRTATAGQGTAGVGVPASGALGWDATNSLYRRLAVNAAGQMATSNGVLTASGTSSTGNTDIIASQDVSAYTTVSFNVVCTVSANRYAVQASNDGSTWYPVPGSVVAPNGFGTGPLGGFGYNDTIMSSSAYSIPSATIVVPVFMRYIRLRLVSFSSGSAAATMVASNAPLPAMATSGATQRYSNSTATQGTLAMFDAVGMSTIAVTMSSSGTAKYVFEASTDNTLWFALNLLDVVAGTYANNFTGVGDKLWAGPINARWLRIRFTAGTGTVALSAELSSVPTPPPVQQVAVMGTATVTMSGGSITADTELPAAAVLADATANPTTPTVASAETIFNGTTWDRTRAATIANATTGTGVPAAGLLGWDATNSLYRRVLVDANGYVLTKSTSPASLAGNRVQVNTAGTRVQLPNQACTSVVLKAATTNAGPMYVGSATVTSAYGIELWPGDTLSLEVANTNLIYVDCLVNLDIMSYIYLGVL